MDEPARLEFSRLMTQTQRSLYAFVRTLVVDRIAAEDILQETNLALWRQAERFEAGSNFAGWASRVAYFKVLNYRRRQQRDRLLLSDSLLEKLAEETTAELEGFETRKTALLRCVDALPPERQLVLDLYFGQRLNMAQIGEKLHRSAGAVNQLLVRLRTALRDCVRRRLSAEEYL